MNLADQQILFIVIPSFNDWKALEKLLLLIDQILLNSNMQVQVLIVDDYSTEPIPASLRHQQHHQIKLVNILRLRRNMGHQRAIAIGLSYVYAHLKCDYVVVMDGDGEDNPLEIERLLQTAQNTENKKIVFAKRSKRSENYQFKFFYLLYKKIYQLLIGKEISVGNFSLIPVSLLKNVVVISEIWNHYSSAIHRSKIPYVEVAVPRSRRLDGQSKMNLVGLITHGLSSIAVYGDVVGTRILLITVILLIAFLLGLFCVAVVRIFTNWSIPGWASYISGLLILSFLQLILIGTVFSMLILATRNSFNLIPVRDYEYYVDELMELKP